MLRVLMLCVSLSCVVLHNAPSLWSLPCLSNSMIDWEDQGGRTLLKGEAPESKEGDHREDQADREGSVARGRVYVQMDEELILIGQCCLVTGLSVHVLLFQHGDVVFWVLSWITSPIMWLGGAMLCAVFFHSFFLYWTFRRHNGLCRVRWSCPSTKHTSVLWDSLFLSPFWSLWSSRTHFKVTLPWKTTMSSFFASLYIWF